MPSGQPAVASAQSQAENGEIISKRHQVKRTLQHRSIAEIRACFVHNEYWTYMVDGTRNSGQPVLDRFFINRLPQRASIHISELLLWIDPHLIYMPGEVDDEATLSGRGTCRVVASSADGDGEVIGAGKCDGDSDIGGCADKSDEFWAALCVGSPACDGSEIVSVGGRDDVAGEVGFEVNEIRHSNGGEIKSLGQRRRFSHYLSSHTYCGPCVVDIDIT